MSGIDSNKVYFAYTKHVDVMFSYLDPLYIPDTTRATVAMRKVGNEIHFGISVCSEGDNFKKEIGRKIAEERLNAGYGKFLIGSHMAGKFKDDHELCLYFLNCITNATQKNLRRAQYKIGEWNRQKQNEATVKIVEKIVH